MSSIKTGKIHGRHGSRPQKDDKTDMALLAEWFGALYLAYRDRRNEVCLPDIPDGAIDHLTYFYRKHFLAKNPSYQDRVDAANAVKTYLAGIVDVIRVADSAEATPSDFSIPPCPISSFISPR